MTSSMDFLNFAWFIRVNPSHFLEYLPPLKFCTEGQLWRALQLLQTKYVLSVSSQCLRRHSYYDFTIEENWSSRKLGNLPKVGIWIQMVLIQNPCSKCNFRKHQNHWEPGNTSGLCHRLCLWFRVCFNKQAPSRVLRWWHLGTVPSSTQNRVTQGLRLTVPLPYPPLSLGGQRLWHFSPLCFFRNQ